MESFRSLLHSRYSVRSYLDTPVEAEKLAQILAAARLAPTAANRQPFRIVVVQDPQQLAKFRPLCRFREPPLVLIVCGVPAEAWVRPSDGFSACLVDTSIVCDHMMLAATELGLGSLWMTSFDLDGVRQAFGIARDLVPHHLLCLGYPAGEKASPDRFDTGRRPLSDLVSGL